MGPMKEFREASNVQQLQLHQAVLEAHVNPKEGEIISFETEGLLFKMSRIDCWGGEEVGACAGVNIQVRPIEGDEIGRMVWVHGELSGIPLEVDGKASVLPGEQFENLMHVLYEVKSGKVRVERTVADAYS